MDQACANVTVMPIRGCEYYYAVVVVRLQFSHKHESDIGKFACQCSGGSACGTWLNVLFSSER